MFANRSSLTVKVNPDSISSLLTVAGVKTPDVEHVRIGPRIGPEHFTGIIGQSVITVSSQQLADITLSVFQVAEYACSGRT